MSDDCQKRTALPRPTDCLPRVLERRHRDDAVTLAPSLEIGRDIGANDVARGAKQILEILPLGRIGQVSDVERTMAQGHRRWVRIGVACENMTGELLHPQTQYHSTGFHAKPRSASPISEQGSLVTVFREIPIS